MSFSSHNSDCKDTTFFWIGKLFFLFFRVVRRIPLVRMPWVGHQYKEFLPNLGRSNVLDLWVAEFIGISNSNRPSACCWRPYLFVLFVSTSK